MKKLIIFSAILIALSACTKHEESHQREVKSQPLSINEASRIARSQVVELTPIDMGKSWYEAIIQHPNGNKGIIYINPVTHRLIAGALFDADTGVNLTAAKGRQKGFLDDSPANTSPSTSVDMAKVEQIKKDTVVIHYGDKDSKQPPLTFIVDPQCPYCHQAWPFVMKASARIPVDVIVVGVLGEDSTRIAADIIARNDPLLLDKVMQSNEQIPSKADPDSMQRIRSVSNSVLDLGVNGVPVFIRDGRMIVGWQGESALRSLL